MNFPIQANDIATYLMKRYEEIVKKIEKIKNALVIGITNDSMIVTLQYKMHINVLRDELQVITREMVDKLTIDQLYDFCGTNLNVVTGYYGMSDTVKTKIGYLNTADKIKYTDMFSKLHYSFK